MLRNRLIGAGLATGALLISGCGEDVGSSVSAGKGECIPFQGSVVLAPDQKIYAGGDIHYEHGVTDRLLIKNIGNNILMLDRSGGDGGKIRLGKSNAELPSKDGDESADSTKLSLVVSAADEGSNTFSYEEGSNSFSFAASQLAKQTIKIDFTSTCK